MILVHTHPVDPIQVLPQLGLLPTHPWLWFCLLQLLKVQPNQVICHVHQLIYVASGFALLYVLQSYTHQVNGASTEIGAT